MTATNDYPLVPTPEPDRLDEPGPASRGLRLPTALLAAWCLLIFAWWLPGYLTWPYFTDHDHFATVAQAWGAGRLPYRDVFTNQFPGEIYLFRALGSWCGWGNPAAFYAVDAALVFLFGLLTVAWSRRRFGFALPGLLGLDVFLTYYLSLDFDVAGQRDWHAAFFGVASFYLLDLVPGLAGRIAAGAALGCALGFRPQFLLLVPGLSLAVDRAARAEGEPWSKTLKGVVAFGASAALTLAAAFLPLIRNGLMWDFVRCIRSIRFGAGLSAAPVERLGRLKVGLTYNPALALTAVALALLAYSCPASERRRGAFSVLAALAGMVLYGVVSPSYHAYYQIPVVVFLGVTAACTLGLLLPARNPAMIAAVAALLIAAAAPKRPDHLSLRGGTRTELESKEVDGRSLAVTYEPEGPVLKSKLVFQTEGSPGESSVMLRGVYDIDAALSSGRPLLVRNPSYGPFEALDYLRRRVLPEKKPPGRREWTLNYPWRDYRAVVEHLRAATEPESPLASLLLDSGTAVNAMVPRPSPFLCDQVGMILFPEFLGKNLEALKASPGSVVIWNPASAERRWPQFAELFAFVRENYRPEARFGRIEVWRRPGP